MNLRFGNYQDTRWWAAHTEHLERGVVCLECGPWLVPYCPHNHTHSVQACAELLLDELGQHVMVVNSLPLRGSRADDALLGAATTTTRTK